MTYIEKLSKAVVSGQSCLCVGLDPNPDLIPSSVKKKYPKTAGQVVHFLKQVIDVTQDYCAAYKPNLGFFEALGAEGLQVFQEVLDFIPDEKIVIADAKRGDISSTADHYAKAYFDIFDVDAITLNPLMGFETLDPFLNYPEKSIYTLTLTSNSGAQGFLMQPFREHASMAAFIAKSLAELQTTHATHLGMVVGATKPDQITDVIDWHDQASLLIPGIGTQGGSISALSDALRGHLGIPLINSSRSIIYAGGNSARWKEAVAEKAREVQQALQPILSNYI